MDSKGQALCFSSPRDPQNKENHHTESGNNLNMPIVAEDPQQTRKRKKGRGFNLRKSLAWNKAFLTEEGVLNPQELSILSGSLNDSSKSFLSRVNESPSPSPGSRTCGDRSVLKALEDNLFEEMPARFQNGNQKLNGLFSNLESIQEDSPLPKSARKVQLAKVTNRSVAQGGGCPRPTASHSQQKITNTSTIIGMSKIPRPLAPKVDSSRLSVTPKCVVQPAKRSKGNNNAPPVIPLKNTSLKGPSACTGKGLSCTVSSKCSVPSPGKHKIPQVVGAAINTASVKVIPEEALHVDMHASASLVDSNEDNVRLPQHIQHINGNVQSVQCHTKPSGLRMPSPSLGYFCQGKVSASRSYLSHKTKTCDLSELKSYTAKNPCDFNHIGELKPPSISCGWPPKSKIGVAAAGTAGNQVSSASNSLFSSITPVKSNSEMKTLRTEGPKDSSDSWSKTSHINHFGYDNGVSKQNKKKASIMADPDETKQVSYKENPKLLMKSDFFQAEIVPFAQPHKDDGFEYACDDTNASGDTSGIVLVIPHSLSQVGCGKQPTQYVPQLNNVVEHPHVEDAAFKEPPAVNECQRPSNDHCPPEIYHVVPGNQSTETENSIDQGFCEEAESSLGLRDEQVADVGNTKSLESVCSSTENIASTESRLLSEETLTALSGTRKQPDTGFQTQLMDASPTKDETAALVNKNKHVSDNSRQDHISTDYRANIMPFSDEWVAALEAVGEDILTMKTGAVQNSPPDKTIPEPGPYSPVKRNTQDIGPFDCTKYTSVATSDIQ